MLTRKKSLEEDHELTMVDKVGMYLSARKVIDFVKKMQTPISCLDIGCGHHARQLMPLLPYLKEGIGIDMSVSKDLRNINKLRFIESPIEKAFEELQSHYFDLVLMISVLEHLNDPFLVLQKCYEVLKGEGVLIINVPTWRGKFFLELVAFKSGLSPNTTIEVDDHKMYYDKKDLWPLIVKAGFKPSNIKLNYYKFGLNLFCEARKS